MDREDIIRMAEEAEHEADISLVRTDDEGFVVNSPDNTYLIREREALSISYADFGDAMIAYCHMKFIDGAPAIWASTRYLVGLDAIYSAMVDIYRDITSTQRKEVMSYLQLRAPKVSIADPRFIAFENGVLDLETLDLLSCTPELAITNVIPHNWNPDAECPELDAALDAWTCGHEDRLALLLETVGLCMYRGREFQMCPLLLGEGANGKSTFMNMLTRVIGADNISALEIKAIGKRFQSVALMGKLANLTDDVSSDFVNGDALAVFKKVVSGDLISAEYKGGTTFMFRPYCTMVISANQMPRMDGFNEAIIRRLSPMPFEAKFTKAQGNLDINISRVLEREESCERLIFLGVTALREALTRGTLTETKDRASIIEDLRLDNSSVYEFAVEELGFGTDGAEDIIDVPTGNLFMRYEQFCSEANRMRMRRNLFSSEICEIYGVKLGRKWMWINGERKQVRCFVSK